MPDPAKPARPDRRIVGGPWTTTGKKVPVPLLPTCDYELRWVNFQLVGTATQYVTIGSGASPWFRVTVGNAPVILRDFNPVASTLTVTDDGNSGNTLQVIGS
jgi:hypothetical protein